MKRVVIKVMCRLCEQIFDIEMSEEQYQELQNTNKKIQYVLPNHTPAERELIISHTCGDCWNTMFKDED